MQDLQTTKTKSHNTLANSQNQSLHWADKLAKSILSWQKKYGIKKLHVDDMKTPSGRVHVGALRGVILHDVVAKALAEHTSQEVVSTYIFNDMDSVDKIPAYLPKEKFQPWLGKPLYQTPPPTIEESGIDFSHLSKKELKKYQNAKSYAEFYALDFIDAFRYLDCSQEIVWSHELYQSGKMDDIIKESIEKIAELKEIYKNVADYTLPEKWYPIRPFDLRPQVNNTITTSWNGKEISYNSLDKNGAIIDSNTTTPFGDTGKLLWKVDWPAHWKVLGITIEGAGKDHTSAGGSRDMANAICKQVFNIPEPFDIPYEWVLIRGAKMSSSKGIGTSAREFVMLFPPAVGRFLFINKHYNQVIDFDPRTMSIPDLFDEYDQGARIFWNLEKGDTRVGRAFELSQTNESKVYSNEPYFLPRFRDVAIWMQHPEIDLIAQFEEIKGSPLTPHELTILEERKKHARIWINSYAPDEFKLTPPDNLNLDSTQYSEDEITFLKEVFALTKSKKWNDPQLLQQTIFDLAKTGIGSKAGFKKIYQTLIGKEYGPKAAWLLLATPQHILDNRMNQLTGKISNNDSFTFKTISNPKLFRFSKTFLQKYPSATVGYAVIKDITIENSNDELEQQKSLILREYEGITTKSLGEYPEIQSYRKMYKDMGIDWHSRRPSPEALLRRVAQGKELYSVNTCVDAYNIAVMKNRVSVGAFDLDRIVFPTQLKIAKGGEKIHLLGDNEPTILKTGEVSYFDQKGPYNLDYNYRDAQRTMVTDKTTSLLINVEGVYDISRSQVETTLQETIDLITHFCGGSVETAGIAEKE